MILSDRSIKERIAAGRIVMTPFDAEMVQPASIDIRLDTRFRVFRNYRYASIDPRAAQEDLTELVTIDQNEEFLRAPGRVYAGQHDRACCAGR